MEHFNLTWNLDERINPVENLYWCIFYHFLRTKWCNNVQWKPKSWIWNHTLNQSEKLKSQADATCVNFITATHSYSVVCMAPEWLCALLTHLGMLPMSRPMVSWGSSPRPGSGHQWAPGHSGGTWRCRCSIGFRSGERQSQSIASMPLSSRNCLHTLATWGRALSCTRRNPGPTAPA